MVQALNNSTNQYGTVSKIGQTKDGRVIYKINDTKSNQSTTVSVAQKDCDKFEKSYKEILETAPQLQKELQNQSPKEIERKKTISKWIMGSSIAIGAGIPLIKAKGKTWKQALFTLGGTLAGAITGLIINTSIMTPKGASKFAKATQNLSKLDIKPVQA